MPSDVAPFPSSPTPPVPPVIEVTDVSKTFDGRTVLDGVSLTVRRGETLVIMGASGCGKSTLLRCLIGAHSVDSGSVKLFGKDIAALRPRDLDTLRKRYGILFQSGALFSSMSVGQNVALPLKEHTKLGGDMIDLMVKVKLELVGLREAEDRLPSEISGGMAKRAGLARAIALDPELLFYDEPTSGLDPIMTGIIDGLITDLARTMNVTSVVVTHDLQSAFRVADRMVVLNNGRIVLQGLPNEIRASQDPFVRRFIHGPTESKTVVMTRSSMERTVAPAAGIIPHTGATLVSSGVRRAVSVPNPMLAPLPVMPPPKPMPYADLLAVPPVEPLAAERPEAIPTPVLNTVQVPSKPSQIVVPERDMMEVDIPERDMMEEPPKPPKSEMFFMRRSTMAIVQKERAEQATVAAQTAAPTEASTSVVSDVSVTPVAPMSSPEPVVPIDPPKDAN
ncbi:MAG: ABC transporter ATP-binding protein [Planctomycetota bacterium]